MAQPNFVFILIDDMGWKDICCYGSSFYETPNLDRLAQQGMRFTDAYASCPVCSPTRASIMAGKYPATVQITNYIAGMGKGKLLSSPYLHQLPHSEKSIASVLREAGYATWHVGKWHLGEKDYYPDKHGFDVNIGGCHIGHPYKGYFSPYHIETLPDGPEGEYLTDRLTDEAISLIRNRNADKPFFLNLWHYAVHTPIQAPQKYLDKYRKKAAALGLDKVDPFEAGEFYPIQGKQDRRIVRRTLQSDIAYAAMVQNLDENIGRVLDELDRQGIADNTVVIFTSDNGGLATAEGSPTCNAPLAEGKGWMYEGATREPLIVRWPGRIAPDSVCTQVTTSPDFYPTLLEMAGLPLMPEQHVDGVSILPLLTGSGVLDREAVFWHYPHYSNQGGAPGCAVRAGDFKLIEFFEDNHLELYNLREDIGEERNLAAYMPDLTRRLQTMLHDWLARSGAKIPQPNPDYQTPKRINEDTYGPSHRHGK